MFTKSSFNFLFKSQFWFVAVLAALMGLYAYLLFHQLGSHAFIDFDEGIYAQVAKESFEHHNQATLTLFGQPWFEKPPFLFWITQVGYSLFGITEFGARFFVALLAVLTVGISAVLAYIISRSRMTTLFTVAAFFFFPQIFANSFFLNIDTLLTFWIVLAMLGYALVRRDARWWLLFFASSGFAVLTKGAAGLYPLVIASVLAMIERDVSFCKSRYFWWGTGVFATIILPWHILQSVRHGSEFWDSYLCYHVLVRYTSEIKPNGAPFTYFVNQILLYPALALVGLLAIIHGVYASYRQPHYRVPLVSLIVIFLIISFSKTKLLGYAIPLYPFLAICIGLALMTLVRILKKNIFIIPVSLVLVLTFIFFGWQMNKYKIAKVQSNLAYEQTKAVGAVIQDLPENKRAIVGPYEYSGLPALWFYAGKKLEQWPEGNTQPDTEKVKRLYHSASKSLYEFPGFYYVRIDAYNP
jgi:4-amino-4-deoxy-L-arabinose transferase-like glycosyltransferase